jgi:hypothetical protein
LALIGEQVNELGLCRDQSSGGLVSNITGALKGLTVRGNQTNSSSPKPETQGEAFMTKNLRAQITIAAVALGCSVLSSQAESPVKLGELTCMVSEVDQKLLKTHVVLDCAYVDVNGNNAGNYQGQIDRTGLDIGNMKTEQFTWVVSTLGDPADTKIAGTYIGAAAGASVGAGAGGNYLAGGFDGKISLQPLSVESESGFGVSLAGQKLVLEQVAN